MGSFGKRVLGEQGWQIQEAAANLARDRGINFGSRVTGPATGVAEPPSETVEEVVPDDEKVVDAASADETAPKAELEAPTPLSLKKLDIALVENTTEAFFDEMMEAEFARVEGPRKGGLRLLLASEEAQDEPRAAIVTELTKALKV